MPPKIFRMDVMGFAASLAKVEGPLIGIDFGTKRIGIAVSDSMCADMQDCLSLLHTIFLAFFASSISSALNVSTCRFCFCLFFVLFLLSVLTSPLS